MISLVERGHLDRVSLRTLRDVAASLDVSIVVLARWRAGDIDRLLNAGHAAMHELVARRLDSIAGWEHSPEVSYSIYGERGVIDVLAFHEPTGALLVVELKTALVSLEDLLTSMDRRLRLAPSIARERGWRPVTASGWVVVPEGTANPKRARQHAATLRSAFPADGQDMRRWLRSPDGGIRALSFCANSNGGGVTRPLRARKRVRCRSGPAR